MELISVVVATYNSGKTVIETLESIRKQTYANLELIVSDDHSTDNTVKLVGKWLRKYQNRFAKVRFLIAKKNHGVTKNCNIAINQAHGKYVQLVAGDDILLEQAIERKYEFAERKSLKLVCSKVELFGNNFYKVSGMKRLCERCYKIMMSDWEEQYKNIFKFNFVIGPMCGFYLMDYFKASGGFDISYPMLEDWPFMLHYIVSGNKIEPLDEVLTRYRISDTSLSVQRDIPYMKSEKKFCRFGMVKELIRNRRFKDAIIRLKYLF